MPGCMVSQSDFMQFLVNQTPVYDKLIMADVRPTDGWLVNVHTENAPPFDGEVKRLDRMRHVWPNTSKVWTRVQAVTGCLGNPCDPPEHCIGYGAERIEYYPERQSWCTPLFCYDQALHVTHAREHWRQIISDILRPATQAIQSAFLRKRWINHAGLHLTANATQTPFTFAWAVGGALGDEEIFFDCSVPPNGTFKLTPPMLQRRFSPLMLRGYGGKNPFAETAPYIELVTDIETAWDMEKLGGIATAAGAQPGFPLTNWRFTQWDATSKFWRYGYAGQLGNFQVRADPMALRFNFLTDLGAGVGANRYRYQLIPPYTNQAVAGAGGDPGLGSVDNPHYQTACYTISGTWHKMSMDLLVQDATPVNSEMPFSARNLGGKWQFVMHDLGADDQGVVIDNSRGNKGKFIADFELWIRPKYTEFNNLWFHKREPLCITELDICNPCEYPNEVYDSCPPACEPLAL